MGRHYPSSRDLDVFSQQRFPDIATRWNDARRRHRGASNALWIGMVATEFEDDELAILNIAGYFSPNDCDLIRQAGRSFEREQSDDTTGAS